MQWQSPSAAAAEALSAQTIADARAAAEPIENDPTPEPTPDTTETPTPEPTPDPIGTITPGESVTVDATAEVGATIDFSGHEVTEPLDVQVTPLPDAVSSVASETGSEVVTVPFDVTATTQSGAEVTSFPADPTFEDPDIVQPVLLDVDPGVELSIAVTPEQLEGVDPATVRIVTRENEGDPWVELPSYYDAETGTAIAESNHLSQFAVIGVPFVPPGPRIVLDPDDDVGYTDGPNGSSSELGYNLKLANLLAAQLKTMCNAQVTITRNDINQPTVGRDTRAGAAAAWNPDLTVTVAFNALYGYAWGGSIDDSEGGTLVWGRGSGADTALRDSLIANMPGYTQRPAHVGSDPQYPWSDFDGLPGAMVHLETLFIDHNGDRAVLDSPGGWEAVSSGVATGLGMYAESLGYDCTDPVTGGWPAKPSEAQIAAWKQLGYHYQQVYGGDPVSFSTGNLVEDEPIFTLAGPGSQAVDLTLVYNSQDGRQSRAGTGWSFGLGARAQRFDDKSVLVVRGDGASEVFEPDGVGGYTADPDVHNTLVESGGGRLTLTSPAGETWVFDASDIDGIGELTSYTDLQGNGYTLGYGPPTTDPNGDPYSADHFVPLTSITDAAGQVISLTSDALGHIASITHPDGRTWSLGYGPGGDLVSITNPDGRVRTFTYDSGHRMLTATDAAGVTYLVNEYDTSGRVVKQWDADGNLRTFAFGDGTTVYTNNEGAQSTYEWDELSRITSITDALGGVERFEYDADGNTSKHTDQAGNVTEYEYDDDGNLTRETAPDGGVSSYTYTPTGVLASSTDAAGRTTSFDVDARGLTTAAHLPDGSTVSFAYTASGDLASVTDQAGNTTTYGYDSVGNLTSVTDPLGQVTTTTYDAAGRATTTTDPTGATTSYTWDAADRLVASTDALGATTTYGYDANDHVTSITDALGAVTGFEWDAMFHLVAVTAPDGGVTRYTYDSEDNLTSVTDPLGAVTTLQVDALGRPTAVTDAAGSVWLNAYDELGQLTEATDPLGAVTRYAYDVMGRPTTVTDPSGAVSSAAYDAVGRLTQTTDATGATISYAYTVLDQLAAVTDQLGQSTSYRYDSVGNPTTTTDRRGQKWTAQYDAIGRVTSATDPTGATTRFEYDAAAREVRVVDAMGNVTVTAFDELGRTASVTDPLGAVSSAVYDAADHLTQTIDANGAVSTATYDVAGRVTALTDALGAVSKLAYDLNGQVVKATDPNGVATAYRYDALGQLTQVIDGYHTLPTTATGTDVNVTTKYSYTSTGMLASSTDANGAVTKYEYDSRGLPTAETNPLGITTRTSYDALGRPVSTTDGNGATTRYGYTPRSDLATIAYPDGVTVGFEYDADQNQIVMTDGLGSTGWAYDRAGRMVSQTDPNGATLGWSYDPAGQLTALTVPGATIGYGYDAAGRVVSQSSPWGSLDYAYDPVGNLLSEARSSGITTTNTYDAVGQVVSISHQTPALPSVGDATSTVARWDGSLELPGDLTECPAGTRTITDDTSTEQVASYLDDRTMPGTTIAGCEKTAAYASGRGLPAPDEVFAAGDALTYSYAYDKAGNVTSETEDRGSYGSVSTQFAYDDLSHLIASSSSDGTSNAYTYDRVGNRTNWVTNAAPDTGLPLSVSSTFNAAGQATSESRSRPDGVTSLSYSYNGAGQRTQQSSSGPDESSVVSYSYTGAGRLASATQDGNTTSFGYDGLGRNLRTSTDSEESTNVWAGMSVVQQTSDVAGTATLLRDALGQVALQSSTPGDISSGAAWSLQDRLGSTMAQTTTNGRITDLASYSDFGIPTFDSTGFASSTGFTGEVTDATTGLNSYFSRTYDPMSATWLSADSYRGTLTNPASQHRYGYVEGNPATYLDRFGFRLDDPGAYAPRTINKGSGVHVAPQSGPRGSECSGNACDRSKLPPRHVRDAMAATNPANMLARLGDQIFGPLIGFGSGIVELATATWQVHPLNWLGQLVFLGADKTNASLVNQALGYANLIQAVKQDPVGVGLAMLGDMFAVDKWATSPGQATGKSAFTIATFLLPGGAAVKAATLTSKAATISTTSVRALESGSVAIKVAEEVASGSKVPWLAGKLPGHEEVALLQTLEHIDAGTVPTGAAGVKWGTVFNNRDGDLPPGSYTEYRVPAPPGVGGAGPLRVVQDSVSGAIYYTWTHYGDAGNPAFVRVR